MSPQDAGLVCRGPVCRAFLRATAQAGPARFGTRETPPKPGGLDGAPSKGDSASAAQCHSEARSWADPGTQVPFPRVPPGSSFMVSSSRRAARASGDSQESGRPFDFGVVWWRSLRKNNPPLVIPKPALSATKARFGMTICLGIFKLHHCVGLCCVGWKLRESSGGISPPTQPGPEPGLASPVLLPAGLRQV